MKGIFRLLLLLSPLLLLCSCNSEADDGIVTVTVAVRNEKRIVAAMPVFTPASTYVYKAVPATGNTATHGYAPEWTESGSTDTATLSFELAVGIWHLTVGLNDTSGNLVYESDTMTVNISPSNTSLSVVLYPCMTGTGTVSVNISVLAATAGGSCMCCYTRRGGSENSEFITVGTHSPGESATITGTLSSLESGFYTFRFIFREIRDSHTYGSGSAVSVLVLAGQTSTISGTLAESSEIV